MPGCTVFAIPERSGQGNSVGRLMTSCTTGSCVMQISVAALESTQCLHPHLGPHHRGIPGSDETHLQQHP